MNWSRVKTILIVLFLCTDIFLLGIYFTSKHTSSEISGDVIDSIVKILANNDIKVKASSIPRKMPSVPNAEAQNVMPDYETFAKTVLGDDLSAIDFGYASGRGKITFYGDRFNFIANPETYAVSDRSIADEVNAKEIVTSTLKPLGFDLGSAKISVTETADGGHSVELRNYAKSLPMFNSKVVVTLSNTEITSISGIWFNEVKTSDKNESTIKNVTSALIDFIPMVSEATEITAIKHGYGIFDTSSFHKTVKLIPVWEVTAKDGSSYLLDGRNIQ